MPFGAALSVPKKTANILLHEPSPSTLKNHERILEHLGPLLSSELKPFQLAGIGFGIQRNGRVLIGDEMGLGKTLQALAIAAYFSDDWPLLVVCPSSIRFQWRDQALRWLPHKLGPDDVCVIRNGKMDIPYDTKMVIISYDLFTKQEKYQHRFQCAICDESHYIKSNTAKRTKVLVPILRASKRAILLSGTPALNKPVEIYEQLNSLLPDLTSLKAFAERYCIARRNPFSRRIEYVGYQHCFELHQFLSHTIMIRRLKKDVQKELPPKMRSRVPVEIAHADLLEIKAKMQENQQFNRNAAKAAEESTDIEDEPATFGTERGGGQSAITELFTLTGRAKRAAAQEYVAYMVQADVKFLVFAHHIEMLDALEDQVKKEKVRYIRIDGRTPGEKREILVKEFQSEDSCKVAILSITACAHGLNLTAAGTVVFAELYWVPGQMIQAEDRTHRIGTNYSNIQIHYLIAEDTLDDKVYEILQRKWAAMTSSLDGVEECINMSHLCKGSVPDMQGQHRTQDVSSPMTCPPELFIPQSTNSCTPFHGSDYSRPKPDPVECIPGSPPGHMHYNTAAARAVDNKLHDTLPAPVSSHPLNFGASRNSRIDSFFPRVTAEGKRKSQGAPDSLNAEWTDVTGATSGYSDSLKRQRV
eukprot:GHVT01088071.1.p1 GENE.GHVT01088071.1~~GHVT01088071.1.p1  ORF type:complete len:643 (+),score=38.88 GHVT01088071.1:1946-3874(+)